VWLADDSPGKMGDPEIWLDEGAVDSYIHYGHDPDTTASNITPSGNYVGTVIHFNEYPGLTVPAVYVLTTRRWSQANGGRPYYVARWPD
jgi:hypothetical protein